MNKHGSTLKEFLEWKEQGLRMKQQCMTLSEADKNRFFELMKELDEYHNAKEKGLKLEELIYHLLDHIPIFEAYKNIRTSTNEIDIFVNLSDIGKIMLSEKIIDLKSEHMIIECKNYDKKKINVTWVGKFCSLLLHSPARVGIIISHKGFAGHNWDSAKGLAKKFYYYKEHDNEKKYILDINLEELCRSVEANQFVDLILNKIQALENDTQYTNYIIKHPNEEKLNEIYDTTKI